MSRGPNPPTGRVLKYLAIVILSQLVAAPIAGVALSRCFQIEAVGGTYIACLVWPR